MSGMMDKVKAKVDNVLHKDKSHDDTTGPHSSHTANTADPTTHSGTGHSTVDPTTDPKAHHDPTAGVHSAGANNSFGSSGTHGSTGLGSSTTHGSSTYNDPSGPHTSHTGNKLDPRVDGDRYDATGNTSGPGAYSSTGSGLTGSSTTHGTTGSGLGHDDPTGPHSSHMANKADPRVDDDVGGAGGYGSVGGNTSGMGNVSGMHTKTVPGEVPGDGQGHLSHRNNEDGDLPKALKEPYSVAEQHRSPSLVPAHSSIPGDQQDDAGRNTHDTTTTSGGLGSSSTGYNDPSGPHSSHAMNSADPRVDSDRFGSSTGPGGIGAGQHGSTAGGLGHHNDPTGPHSSHAMNSADPRVDSDRFGSSTGPGGIGAGQHGSTAGGLGHHNDPTGPHSSHAMNSADPRVDSDRFGSSTGSGDVGSGQYGSTTGPGGVGSDQYGSSTGQYDNTGKPSLKDKLHPKKDADGDGKAGIMS